MKKFKFMSKLAAGMMAVAMTFGTLGSLGMNAPMIVYAAGSEATSVKISGPQVVAVGGSGTYAANVSFADENDSQNNRSVTWAVTGGSGTTKIDTSGVLTVDAKETATKLTIKATSAQTTSVSAEFEVMVGTGAYLDINYEFMSASIESNGDDSFFFFEVLKDENGTKPGTVYCYEGVKNSETGKIKAEGIDLSFLKISKPVYIRVYGDKNPTPLKIYTVAAQPKKPSVKYVAGQDTFYKSFQLDKKDLDATTVETLQFRTQYGADWLDFSYLEEAMSSLTVAGTTILVRAISPDWDKPATTEVKVKIAAVPKAPKVTLDYAKNAIKLPKTSEIRVPGWIIPSQVEEKNGSNTTYTAVETPFYYTVGSNKDDLTVAPMDLATKLVEKYIEEYNAAQAKLNSTLQTTATNNKGWLVTTGGTTKYAPITVEDVKDNSGKVTQESDKTVLLNQFEEKGYKFLIRTAAGKKAASQPTFVDVKAAPVIAIRQKEDPSSAATPKAKLDENVVAVMVDQKKDDGTTETVATTNTLTFVYDESGLKLTPAGSYVYAYSLDGGAKFSKLSKETVIKLDKIDATKGVIVRTEGAKEDAKKNVVGNWASNELTLPVPVSTIEVKGDTEVTEKTAVTKTYTATVKDALGQEVKDATLTWSVSGGTGVTADAEKGTVAFTTSTTATKVTVTATYKDAKTGVETKGTIEVEVKAAAK